MQVNFDIPAANRNPMVDAIIARNRAKTTAPATPPNPDSAALASFNGYYNLQEPATPGAFLTVDTNINVAYNATTQTFDPSFDVSVILCLDGKTPHVFDFTQSPTATFQKGPEGIYTLTFATPAGVSPALSGGLRFARTGMTGGQTATLGGTVSIGPVPETTVSGHTYNNPILPSLYRGAYYTHPSPGNATPAQVMTIGPNFELSYTPLGDSGAPAMVQSYAYNMNMYFFSFIDSLGHETKLIMGTSAAGGLVCNDMTIIDAIAHPRTLTTIKLSDQTLPDTATTQLCQTNAQALADLSGYFPLTQQSNEGTVPSSGAFLSVEGQYVSSYRPTATPEIETKYKIAVGLCLDGVHSTVYYFDQNCHFDTDSQTLTIQGIQQDGVDGSWQIEFTPGYTPGTGAFSQFGDLSAVRLSFVPSGTGSTSAIYTGKTPLGPVPLSAFSGATLTATAAGSNEALEIVSDHSILYTPPALSASWQKDDQQQAWLEILYVPLMYIVAYQVRPDDILAPDAGRVTGMLSLGTNGACGLASINTRYLHLWPSLPPVPCPPTSVLAIPTAA